MDRSYLDSLLQLWGLNERDLEATTLQSTSSTMSGLTSRRTESNFPHTSSVAVPAINNVVDINYNQKEESDYNIAPLEAFTEEKEKDGKRREKTTTTEADACGLEKGNSFTNCFSLLSVGRGAHETWYHEEGRASFSGVVTASRTSFCCSCLHCNKEGIYWCTECGSALLSSSPASSRTSSEAMSSVQQLGKNKTSNASESTGHTHKETQAQMPIGHFLSDTQAISCIPNNTLENNSQVLGNNSDSAVRTSPFPEVAIGSMCLSKSPNKSSEKHTLQQMPKTKKRHWSTSGVYHWRKPSSIKPWPAVTSGHEKLKQGGVIHSAFPHDSITHVQHLSYASFHLLSLPTELLLTIFSYLNHSQLASCMLVCHRIYQIASDSTLWNTIMIYKRRNISDETILNVGKKRPRYLSMVHSSGNVSTRTLHLLFQCVPDLETLTIDACNFAPNTGDQLLISACLNCSQLYSVELRWTILSDKGFKFFVQNCKSLKEITLEYIPQVTQDSFHLLIQKNKNRLTRVELHGKTTFNIESVIECCAQEGIVCPNMVHFHCYSGQASEQNLKKVFPNLQKNTN